MSFGFQNVIGFFLSSAINCMKLILCIYDHSVMGHMKLRKKAKIRNRYNHAPHLTQDTTWESDKNTKKHHIIESQEVSPFMRMSSVLEKLLPFDCQNINEFGAMHMNTY